MEPLFAPPDPRRCPKPNFYLLIQLAVMPRALKSPRLFTCLERAEHSSMILPIRTMGSVVDYEQRWEGLKQADAGKQKLVEVWNIFIMLQSLPILNWCRTLSAR